MRGVWLVTLVAGCGFQARLPALDDAPSGLADADDGAIDTPDATLPRAPLYGHDETRLIRVDPYTFNSTTVMFTLAGGGPAVLEELAVDSSGVIIGQSDAFDQLYRIDPVTGVCTAITSLTTGTGTAFRGMTFVPDGATNFPGERLIGRGGSGRLFDLDVATGMVSEIGNYNGALGTRGDIVWVPGVGLIASAPNTPNDSFVLVDPKTAAASVRVADTGVAAIYGLGISDGKLFAFTGARTVVPLSLTTGTPIAAAITVPDSITWSGGGARLDP